MRVHVRHQQREVRGSTLFAVLINWNSLFSIAVFIPAIWVNFIRKVDSEQDPLSEVERIWYGAVLVLWSCCELPRLYLGISGNRDHLIAPLLMFGVLTAFIHAVVMIVFNFITPRVNALDKGLTAVQILFGVSELVLCLPLGPKMVHQNTVDFYAHLWGQEKFNQQPGDKSQYDREGGGADGEYDDDDDYEDLYHGHSSPNRKRNMMGQQHDPNAPRWAARSDRGQLGTAPSSTFQQQNTNRGGGYNNNHQDTSDSEMDSVEDGRGRNSRGERFFASDREAHRSYTPVGGSQEFLTTAPPASALNNRQSNNALLMMNESAISNNNNASVLLNSPLRTSPSKRAASTVGLVRSYSQTALQQPPPFGESSNQNTYDDMTMGSEVVQTAGQEGGDGEKKKKKKKKRGSSSTTKKDRNALVDEL